jgi:hypothetical protein
MWGRCQGAVIGRAGGRPRFGYAPLHARRRVEAAHGDGGRRPAARVVSLLGWIEWQHLVAAALLWVVLTAGSLAVVLRIALSLPEDYFEAVQARGPSGIPQRVVRNAVGCVLIAVGAALSIPGVPGQGLLTILVGLFFVDFPRRRQLERALARRPGVLAALNRLRARFGRPPLRRPD